MDGGRTLSPNLLFGRKTLLRVPEIGMSSCYENCTGFIEEAKLSLNSHFVD